jgi:CRP/FNR family transcriptional regulator
MKKNSETPLCAICEARGNSIFCGISNPEMEEIELDKDANLFAKHQKIFREGTRPLGLYCINKGKVKIYKSGINGKEQIVRLAKEGDVVGYRSLISGDNYAASAETLEESMICFIPKNVFFNLLHQNHDLVSNMMQLLSRDLKTAENKVTELSQRSVRERVAETILMLRETYGMEPDNETLQVMLSRDDLASIAATATETLIRILSDFSKEKMIELSGKKIRILNMQALLQAAALEE